LQILEKAGFDFVTSNSADQSWHFDDDARAARIKKLTGATLTMKVNEGGESCGVVIVGGPNVNEVYKLVNNAAYPQLASDYETTFAVLRSLHHDLFLGAHRSEYDMESKYTRMRWRQPVD
jgi:hypothetical protein